MSQVQEITRVPVPFWIIVAGGKYDFTAKWWAHERWQAVVDHFAGRILFVQVGDDASATRFLQGLDDNLKGAKFDIVDAKTVAEVDAFASTAELLLAAIDG